MRTGHEDILRTKPVQWRRTCLVVELMGASLRAVRSQSRPLQKGAPKSTRSQGADAFME
jgi:hypothetical protein